MYKAQTKGDLDTQLGRYVFLREDSYTLTRLPDYARLALAVNELAAITLGMGKLYLLRGRHQKRLDQTSPRPIPDLLFVPAYQWTEATRDALFDCNPLERLRKMIAKMRDHASDTLTLEVFVPESTLPVVRIDQSIGIEGVHRPTRGVWICTRAEPFTAGMVDDVMKMGAIVGPNDVYTHKSGMLAKRLVRLWKSHRTYLEQRAVPGDDQIKSVYHWLGEIPLSSDTTQMSFWDEVLVRTDCSLLTLD
ncbi:hypothetical protein SLS58_002148 [Diplodia intermedia]|uniref:Uncharacterized protein n=1 Tax=Diplodia intermedia TaxID=856260 RepID=A0ABR3U0L5_9PEZI